MVHLRSFLTFLLPCTVAWASEAGPSKGDGPSEQQQLAPLLFSNTSRTIPDEYLVMFHQNHTLAEHYKSIGTNLSASGNLIGWMRLLPAYHARLSSRMLNAVRADPGVKVVEADHEVVSMNAERSLRSPKLDKRDWSRATTNDAYWQLAVMTAGKKLSTPVKDKTYQAKFIENAGAGVYMYIFGTGIQRSHVVFQDGNDKSRVTNFQDKETSPYCPGETMNDKDGLGTAVASAAGGKELGTAPGANLVNVKTICDSGSKSRVIQAVSDVTEEHTEHVTKKTDPKFKGSIITMAFSLGDSSMPSWGKSVKIARSSGVVIVAAAGDAGSDKSSYPCGTDGIICVGATDKNYERWTSSNYGSDLTAFAPGAGVLVAKIGKGNDDTMIDSTTSLSAGYTSGTLANFMSFEDLQQDPDTAEKRLRDNSLSNVIDTSNVEIGASPNKLVNNGIELKNGTGQLPYIGAPQKDASACSAAPTVTYSMLGRANFLNPIPKDANLTIASSNKTSTALHKRRPSGVTSISPNPTDDGILSKRALINNSGNVKDVTESDTLSLSPDGTASDSIPTENAVPVTITESLAGITTSVIVDSSSRERSTSSSTKSASHSSRKSSVSPTSSTTSSSSSTSSSSTTSHTSRTSRTSSSSSSSSSSSRSSSATTNTTSQSKSHTSSGHKPTPLTEQSRQCFNGLLFPGHASIDGDAQKSFASNVCSSLVDVSFGPTGTNCFNQVWLDAAAVTYYYSVSWIPGCVTTVNSQSAYLPTGDGGDLCLDLLNGDYENCANGGVGGWRQAGCLNYTFTGAEGDPQLNKACLGAVTTSTVAPTSTTSSTSSSTTTTSSAAPPPTPTSPLTDGQVQCFNEADFPDHGDIQSDNQGNFASNSCNNLDNIQFGPSGTNCFNLAYTDQNQINYFYGISWIDGCVTTVSSQDAKSPTGSGGLTCEELLALDYANCGNGGVGGWIQAGCLNYTFIGALGNPPINKDCLGGS